MNPIDICINTFKDASCTQSQWDLVNKLWESPEISVQVLETLFSGIVVGIETAIEKKLEVSFREKLWSKVFEEGLENTNKIFYIFACKIIFPKFSESEIKKIMESMQTDAKSQSFFRQWSKELNEQSSCMFEFAYQGRDRLEEKIFANVNEHFENLVCERKNPVA